MSVCACFMALSCTVNFYLAEMKSKVKFKYSVKKESTIMHIVKLVIEC